jgi:hypothetical protein
MVFEFGNLYFNRIYIIQSLRTGDKRTGDELLNDIILRRIKNETAEIRDIATETELYNYLDYIKENVNKGYLPFIHFETHGYKDGIELSDGTDISWKDLVPYLRQINIQSRNNLFVSMAACKGGNIQFGVKITEPCPFRGFIGPMEDVWELDLLNSYNEFFDTLLQENDFEKAINALNATAKGVKYHHMNTEAFFDVVIKYNDDLEKNDPKIFNDRIELLLQAELKRNPLTLIKFGSVENLRKWIEEFARGRKPEMFETLRKHFCHINLGQDSPIRPD